MPLAVHPPMGGWIGTLCYVGSAHSLPARNGFDPPSYLSAWNRGDANHYYSLFCWTRGKLESHLRQKRKIIFPKISLALFRWSSIVVSVVKDVYPTGWNEMKQKNETQREAWLTKAADLLWDRIREVHPMTTLPAVKVSMGFPFKRKGKGSHAVGQCWCSTASKEGVCEIFVCPTQDDPITVLGILLHEQVHAAVGVREGHKGPFKRVAQAVGLEGKMTATVSGKGLTQFLKNAVKTLGPYPHRELQTGLSSGPKKDGTRMIKVFCPECEYTVRTTQKWIDVGLPMCPCGTLMTLD